MPSTCCRTASQAMIKKKLPEMLAYYESKGCSVTELSDAMQAYAENGDIEHEKAV